MFVGKLAATDAFSPDVDLSSTSPGKLAATDGVPLDVDLSTLLACSICC